MPFFEDIPLSNISTFDVERYKKARLGTGTKAGTVNWELAAPSHLLTKALEWQWLDKRIAMLKRLPENRGRIVYLTIEQAQRLVTAAMHEQNPHIYPFVVIGLETSMRKSEILSIRREYVDIQRRVIYLVKGTTSVSL